MPPFLIYKWAILKLLSANSVGIIRRNMCKE